MLVASRRTATCHRHCSRILHQRLSSSSSRSHQRQKSTIRQLGSLIQNRKLVSVHSPDFYDVVIVGGGPNGLALAAALRASPVSSSLKIALVESQDLERNATFSASQDAFSNRCSSLTPASLSFLNEIGAFELLDHNRMQPFERMSVWDGVTGQNINFDWNTTTDTLSSLLPFLSRRASATVTSSRTIAAMAENANIVKSLLTRIRDLGGVDMFDKTFVDTIRFAEGNDQGLDLSNWPVVHLSNGSSLTARLLVGADGQNSPVRRFAGIESRGWDYDRVGLVATLRLKHQPEQAIAYQRFLPTGPVALLPLPGDYASLVWSTTPARAAFLKKLRAEDFVAIVNAAFRLGLIDIDFMHTQTDGGQKSELEWRLQHTAIDESIVPSVIDQVQEGSIAAFPLKYRHVDSYVGERVALVGDAAHTIHPLAGQGLNSGLADAQALSSVICDALTSGADIGSGLSLEPYNSSRYTANHVLMGAVDKLHKIYSVRSGPLVAARSFGLGIVDSWSALKGLLMKNAGGT